MLRRCRDYVVQPIQYFEENLREAPDWWLAAAGPIICAGLLGIQATLLGHALRDMQVDVLQYLDVPVAALPSPLLTTTVVTLAYPAWFGVALLAMLAIDVLYRNAAEPGRLAEFAGLCFLTQIPFCLSAIAIVSGLEPEPFRPPSGANRMAAVLAFTETQVSSPNLWAIRVLSQASILWLVSQLTCALKVAARLSTRAAIVAAVFLLLLFWGAQVVGRAL